MQDWYLVTLCSPTLVTLASVSFQKVAQFFEAKRRNRAIVFCLRSELSANDFLNVQDFVAIEVLPRGVLTANSLTTLL